MSFIDRLTDVRDFLLSEHEDLEEAVSRELQDFLDDVQEVVEEESDDKDIESVISGRSIMASGFFSKKSAEYTARAIERELDGVETSVHAMSKGGWVIQVDDPNLDESEQYDEDELDEANPFHDEAGMFSEPSRATSWAFGREQSYFKSGKKVLMSEPGGRAARKKGKDNPIKRNTDKPLGAKGLRGQSSKTNPQKALRSEPSVEPGRTKGRFNHTNRVTHGSSSKADYVRGDKALGGEIDSKRFDVTMKNVKSYAQDTKDKADKSAARHNKLSAAGKRGRAKQLARAESIEFDEFDF